MCQQYSETIEVCSAGHLRGATNVINYETSIMLKDKILLYYRACLFYYQRTSYSCMCIYNLIYLEYAAYVYDITMYFHQHVLSIIIYIYYICK